MAICFSFLTKDSLSPELQAYFFFYFLENYNLLWEKLRLGQLRHDDNFATQVHDPRRLLHPTTKLISFDDKRVQEQFQKNLSAVTVETDFALGSKIVYQSGF